MEHGMVKLASLAAAGAVALLGGMQSAEAQVVFPDPPREFRAVWIATVYNIDWPRSRTASVATQQTQLRDLITRAANNNMNAIIMQIRPAGDALYQSSLEPWSFYLTGREGRAPSPLWDPLAFAITEAHARGIELHAWLNPYRAKAGTYTHATNHASTRIRTVPYPAASTSISWFDPGDQAVQDHSHAIVMDLLTRYDVDAIHFDDYFYPYPSGTEAFPDTPTYQAYQSGGGQLSLSNWRRDSVSRFIQRIQTSMRATKPTVKFGISPFGIWQPGNPSGITGLDAFSSLYADSRLWFNSGWVDYLSPQLYWEIADPGQEFPKLLDWWKLQNTRSRHLWPGLHTSNIYDVDKDWPVTEITNQITTTRQSGVPGHIHYNEGGFRLNSKGIADTLRTGLYLNDALVPASPWLDSVPPPAPTVTSARPSAASAWTLNWTPGVGEASWVWAVQYRIAGNWQTVIVPGTVRTFVLPNNTIEAAGVRAVDRTSTVSAAAPAPLGAPLGWIVR
jgi:uncharacterized lipoprotein YddW (UPF0748 family)